MVTNSELLSLLVVLFALVFPSEGAQEASGMSLSSLAPALDLALSQHHHNPDLAPRQAGSPTHVANTFRGSTICAESKSGFSLDQLAREFPQFYIELGTWLGNITCFQPGPSGTPALGLAPVLADARFELNTTLDGARLYSCSSLGGAPASCRVFYPRFDGSGQYCTVDPVDGGLPLQRVGQVVNSRISVDSAWSNAGELDSAGLNYYEPANDAISGFYGSWTGQEAPGGPTTAVGGRPPALQCLFRVARTCRGPLCFSAPEHSG
jgi:hypothetical protein